MASEAFRPATLAVVSIGEKQFFRVFYFSQSSGVFRLLPAENDSMGTRKMGLPGFDKSVLGEDAIALRPHVQANLWAYLMHQLNAEGNLPIVMASTLVPFVQDEAARLSYVTNEDAEIANQVRFRQAPFLKPPELPLLRSTSGATFRAPQDIHILQHDHEPDYSVVLGRFETLDMYRERCVIQVYPSHDRTLAYSFVQHPTGAIWIAQIAVVGGNVNSFGLPCEAIDGGELLMPLLEYGSQLPAEFVYEDASVNDDRVYTWRYLREIPVIRRWYREVGGGEVPVIG